MKTIKEVWSSPVTKPSILLLGFFLIFVWFRYPQAETESRLSSSVDYSQDEIIIPSIHLRTPVVYVDSHDEENIQQGLSQGAVHLKGTAMPGNVGNSRIVFKSLAEVKIGDDILVVREEQSLVYTAVDIKIISSGDISTQTPASNGNKFLTLQTSYPIGNGDMKYLVIAELK